MCQERIVDQSPGPLPEAPHKYWIIHGQAYDLEPWMSKHPGGLDALLLGRGRDCTELFEQYHVLNNKHLRVLERFRMTLPAGKAALNDLKTAVPVRSNASADASPVEVDAMSVNSLYRSTARVAYNSDPFYEDVKAMVREHGSIKMSTPFVILHCLHFIGLLWSLRMWFSGNLMSAIVLPFFLWVLCAAMVHDGGHFALSRYPAVNKYLNLVAALITNSTGCWYLQHNILHHSYTNLHGKDCDLDSHASWMRIHPEQRVLPDGVHHALRTIGHLLMYPFAHTGLTLISPLAYFRGRSAQRRNSKALPQKVAQDVQTLEQFHGSIVLQVATTLIFLVVPFFRFPFWQACLLTLFPTAMISLSFMVIAQVSHIQLDAEAPTADLEKLHWARRMAITSVDYSQGSYLWAYLTIGLNMQSLHHILPGVSYTQLTALYPKYRAICAKHGVQLLERRNLFHAFCTHVQTLWELSKTHSFAQISRKLA